MNVLIPLPRYGFDPTEAAIPWQILTRHNYHVFFCSPNGQKAQADRIILTGEKQGIWKPLLRAGKDAVQAYREMENSPSFNAPLPYSQVKERDFDVLFLPGGHDKGVKEYLESEILQQLIVDFFKNKKPVAAVCHGPLLVARSINPETGKSVIYNYKTTALLKSQERLAYFLTKLWLKDYYLTYPQTTVEDEVKTFLAHKNNFIKGPFPMFRDNAKHLRRGFVVQDKNYLSARWPGDIYRLSFTLIEKIKNLN